MDDKTIGIVALVLLGAGEFLYCYFAATTPLHTGTIIGAVAGFVTGLKYKE